MSFGPPPPAITLPTFLGIGGQKCGSTWMAEVLREHPQVFMSSPKELHFFTSRTERGWEWYARHFSAGSSFEHRGEFTPDYVYKPEIFSDLPAAIPKLKCICLVRDPVTRSLSHIRQLVRSSDVHSVSGEISYAQLKTIVAEHPKVLRYSRYGAGLRAASSAYGREQLFVADQMMAKQSGPAVARDVFRFLGVDEEFVGRHATEVVSPGITPRLRILETVRRKVYRSASRHAPRVINVVKRSGVAELYRRLNASKTKVRLAPDAADFIWDECGQDWEEVQVTFVHRFDRVDEHGPEGAADLLSTPPNSVMADGSDEGSSRD